MIRYFRLIKSKKPIFLFLNWKEFDNISILISSIIMISNLKGNSEYIYIY